jgi:hypothetical protein
MRPLRASLLWIASLSAASCGGNVIVPTDQGASTEVDASVPGDAPDPLPTPDDASIAPLPEDAPTEPDAPPPPPPPAKITCGTATCDGATQVCCAGLRASRCTAPSECTDSVLSCSDASGCATGEICCYRQSGPTGTAQCSKTCAGLGASILCTTNDECPSGERCGRGARNLQVCQPSFGGGFDAGGFEVGGFDVGLPGG